LNGNDEKAKTVLEASRLLDPNNSETKSALVKVYNRLAGKYVDKNELPKAHDLLIEAENLAPDNVYTNRNLGLVLLLAKRCPEAEASFNKALKKSANDPVTNRLLARALLCQAKKKDAIAAYEKAAVPLLKASGVDLANVYTELGPLYIDDTPPRLDIAVAVLEKAVSSAGPTAVAQIAQRNLAIAYLKRGEDKLRTDPKGAESALEDIVKASTSAPKSAFTPKELASMACVEWDAALKAGKVTQAVEALARAKQGGGCPLKTPYDKMGNELIEFLTGYRDGQSLANRENACKKGDTLVRKNPTVEWLKPLDRSCWELVAFDYFQKGSEPKADGALRAAVRVQVKNADKRDIENNQAVLDLVRGLTGPAEKVFTALAGKPAESLANLGIIKDRQGDCKGALQLYQQAVSHGARSGKLHEWIDSKRKFCP
jgi:tetratricopeptide (TPR) repeat protein